MHPPLITIIIPICLSHTCIPLKIIFNCYSNRPHTQAQTGYSWALPSRKETIFFQSKKIKNKKKPLDFPLSEHWFLLSRGAGVLWAVGGRCCENPLRTEVWIWGWRHCCWKLRYFKLTCPSRCPQWVFALLERSEGVFSSYSFFFFSSIPCGKVLVASPYVDASAGTVHRRAKKKRKEKKIQSKMVLFKKCQAADVWMWKKQKLDKRCKNSGHKSRCVCNEPVWRQGGWRNTSTCVSLKSQQELKVVEEEVVVVLSSRSSSKSSSRCYGK